jgi:Peptidase S24-like
VIANLNNGHVERQRLASEVLRSFGELRLSALGCSMVPTIFPGDILTIRRAAAEELQLGDIVLYERAGRFFVHRLIGKDKEHGSTSHFTFRGDALTKDDPPVTQCEILGKVVLVESGAARFLAYFPSGFSRLLQFGVQRSSLLLKFVLHLHSLRARLHRASFAASTALQERS